MYHYLYLITFKNNMLYVGSHSTKNIPEDDVTYLGSGVDLPERNYLTCSKEILNTYSSREELLEAEMLYILENDCVSSEIYYNKRYRATFDKLGQTASSHINIAITAAKLKGRSKHTHPYLKESGLKKSFYKGDNRTPLQKQHADNMRGISTGKNPAKGIPSIDSHNFVPWYYIDSQGKYTEVLDYTKGEYAKLMGWKSNMIRVRCQKCNEHLPIRKGKLKGYIFGNLDTKPTDIF